MDENEFGMKIQKSSQVSIFKTNGRRIVQPPRRFRTTNPNLTITPSITITPKSKLKPISTFTSTPNSSDDKTPHDEFEEKLKLVDVSGMINLKSNSAKIPKISVQQLQLKYRQTSTSTTTHNVAKAAIATVSNFHENYEEKINCKFPKNLKGGEMSAGSSSSSSSSNINSMAFHPRIKFMNKNLQEAAYKNQQQQQQLINTNNEPEPEPESEHIQVEPLLMTSIPTSVVVPPTSIQNDIKPIIHPQNGMIMNMPSTSGISMSASVIQPTAAALAAAMFQHQLQAAGLTTNAFKNETPSSSTNILQHFLNDSPSTSELASLQNQEVYNNNNTQEDTHDESYNNFDDIHLTEDSNNIRTTNYAHSTSLPDIFQASLEGGNGAMDVQKLLLARAQVQAMRNLKLSLTDYGNNNNNNGELSSAANSPYNGSDSSQQQEKPGIYECGTCHKVYRWKSTLRRHENVECGNKEPTESCPYCAYKSKQRGNLGVHVRKHHPNEPQLESKRRSKYSNTEVGKKKRASSVSSTITSNASICSKDSKYSESNNSKRVPLANNKGNISKGSNLDNTNNGNPSNEDDDSNSGGLVIDFPKTE